MGAGVPSAVTVTLVLSSSRVWYCSRSGNGRPSCSLNDSCVRRVVSTLLAACVAEMLVVDLRRLVEYCRL